MIVKSKITVLSNETATYRVMLEQLRKYLGDLVETEGYSLESGFPSKLDSNLVIALTKTVLDLAEGIIPPGCKTIIPRRSVDCTRIEGLLQIPPGSKIVVASRDMASVKETIQVLKDLGMDHLNYVPWIPGVPCPNACLLYTSRCV